MTHHLVSTRLNSKPASRVMTENNTLFYKNMWILIYLLGVTFENQCSIVIEWYNNANRKENMRVYSLSILNAEITINRHEIRRKPKRIPNNWQFFSSLWTWKGTIKFNRFLEILKYLHYYGEYELKFQAKLLKKSISHSKTQKLNRI